MKSGVAHFFKKIGHFEFIERVKMDNYGYL